MGKDTLVSLLDDSVSEYVDRVATESHLTDTASTYGELDANANRVANHLIASGVQKGDRVAYVTDNEQRVVPLDYGILRAGGISVPVDQRLKPRDLYGGYFGLVQPKLIVVDEKYEDTVGRHSGGIPMVRLDQAFTGSVEMPSVEVYPSDRATIIFSSGTSSNSDRNFKAVALSHDNIASNIVATRDLTLVANRVDGVEQPIAMMGLERHWHGFGYMVGKSHLSYGNRLHFTNPTAFRAGEAAHVNPHYVITVPSTARETFDKIQEGALEKNGSIGRAVLNWFLRQSNDYNFAKVNEGRNLWVKGLLHKYAEKRVYPKVLQGMSDKFGNSDFYLLGGSAALPLHLELSFYSIGRPIDQGYGLTETSPVVSINRRDGEDSFRFGSCGKPIEGVEVKIVNRDHLDRELDDGDHGIVLVRGSNVFQEYVGDSESTRNAFVGGWFNTGDIGTIEDGFLSITGREKNIIVLSNGENIYPEPIESHYSCSDFDLVVVGDGMPLVGGLLLNNNGYGDTELVNLALDRMHDSRERFRVPFNTGNLAVVPEVGEDSQFRTNTLKLRRKLLEEAYGGLIAEICDPK